MCYHAPLDVILRFWDSNKVDIYKLFGNKFIVERNIDIEYPISLMCNAIDAEIIQRQPTFVREYYNMTGEYYSRDYQLYTALCDLMSLETLASNRYSYDSVLIPVPDGKPIALNTGAKAMKMLAKIAETFELKGFEEFRLQHSRILNHKRFKGTLCVSIHPLDYMTMSDNDYNWDSCMSWQKPGEYRQGTIETMNSESVIVAYLKGEEDMMLWNNDPEASWNNKRWRELFYVTPELVTQIRGYPFNDEILEQCIFDILFDLMRANAPDWNWNDASFNCYANKNVVLPDGNLMYMTVSNHVMYNDYSGSHKAYMSEHLFSKLRYGRDYTMNISGATLCLACGEDWTYDWDRFNTEYFECPRCAGEYVCDNCGEYVNSDELVAFADSDDYICHYCADRIGSVCQNCEDWYHDNNLNYIYMEHCGEMLVDEDTIKCCCNCIDQNPLKDEIGPIEYKSRSVFSVGKRYVANTANFSRLGFNLFGRYGYLIDDMVEEIEEYQSK